MLHFAQSLVFYTTSDVVGARWAGLEEELRRAPHVDAALAAHDAFLDAVLRDLLLANHRLLGLVADLERSCDRFCDAADRFSEAALDAATAAARRARAGGASRASSSTRCAPSAACSAARTSPICLLGSRTTIS